LRQLLCSPGWPWTHDSSASTSKFWDYRLAIPHLASLSFFPLALIYSGGFN
jgi:hypothetical protein